MMYRTCGTQLNIDFTVLRKILLKSLKIVNSIVPIAICSISLIPQLLKRKNSNYLSYTDLKFGKVLQELDLPKLFLENLNFEKYADFVINFPILFIKA